ncbi:MAG: hypothetical protein ACN6OB_05330 [Chryseobacterium jejuense]|uniref:hypothetical protein n=1 Tax=Chryseobacterium jejuense TaxID=445960 RepID=UPI003D13C282
MIKIYKIYLILLLLAGIRVFAQDSKITNVVPTTPEMSGLVKRVDIPINYSSGAINYSLNIYTLKVKELEIPITLNYISTGFKPSENSSNIGLGWDLEVGGKISHKVNGLDDLHSPKEYSAFPNGFPVDRPLKMGYANMSQTQNYPEYQLLSENSNSFLDEHSTFMRNSVNRVDTEPDIFHFSYAGKSSKFFLDKDFNGRQMPVGKEKIQFDSNKFVIVDIQGNIYEYAVQDNITLQSSMVMLKGIYPYSGGTIIYNNYYLSKIKTKTDIIEFLYDYVDYAYDNPTSYMKGSTEDYDIPDNYYRFFEVKYISKVTQHTLPVLKEIKVNAKTRASFEYKADPRTDVKNNFSRKISALDKIIIQDGGSNYKIDFNQSYFKSFNSGSVNNDLTTWLKLNSVKINDKQYSFKYYEEDIPQKDSESKDFWGFYSTEGNERYNLKNFKTYYYLGGKKPNINNSQTTLLKEIIYPTKGSDEFFYENNTYNEPSYNEYSVKDINVGIYYSDELSTGVDFNEVVPFEIAQQVKFTIKYNIPTPIGGATSGSYIFYDLKNNSTNTFVQLPPMSDAGEKELTLNPGSYSLSMRTKGLPDPYIQLYGEEIVMTKSGQKNLEVGGVRIAKIVSKDNNGNTLLSKNISYIDNNLSTGKIYDYPLLYELEKANSSKYEPDYCKVLTKYFTLAKYYSTSISDILGYNGATVFYSKVTESSISNGNDNGKITYSFYDDDERLYYDTPFLLFNDNSWKRGFIKKQEFFAKGNSVPVKTITNDYSFIQTPSTQQIESGLDFTAPTKPNEFHKMSYQFFVESPQYALGCAGSFKAPAASFSFYGKKLVSAQVNKDREIIEENLNGKLLKTETEYFYNNSLHIQPTLQKITFPDKSIQETTFQYAHEKGNQYLINKNIIGIPLETTVVNKMNSGDAGKTISKIVSLYPNSDVEANNKTSGLPLPISISSLNVQSNTLTTDVLFKQYQPISGNLLQYNPKPDANDNSSNPVSIVWGYNNTLPIAKIEGANYEQVSSYISTIVGASDTDAAKGNNNDETELLKLLNDFKNNPNLAGFQITTYTYDPLIGVRSITPPSGIREVYLYDTAGRLKEVRENNQTGKLLKEFNYHYKN